MSRSPRLLHTPSGADVSRRPGRSRLQTGLILVGVLCVAASMRSPISSLGAALPDIRAELGFPSVLAGLLTSLPPLVFGLVGAAVPRLVRTRSLGGAMTVAGVLIAFGTAVRGVGGLTWLLIGTAMAMLGIAVANVLLPVVVRSSFPAREGWVTGSYVATMQMGASAGALTTVPMAHATGHWEAGLAAWALPAGVGVMTWLAASRQVSVRGRAESGPSKLTWRLLVRDRLARGLVLFFGLQSTVAYVMMGWLPTILQDAGMDPTAAGAMVAVAIAVSIPVSLLLPGWLANRNDQRSFVWWIALPWAAGFIGLIVAPVRLPILWAALLGFGLASFPVALLLMGLRSATAADTQRVSAFSQGGGYLVALPAPLLFGVLHDFTGTWTFPLSLLLVSLLPLVVYGRRSGTAAHVGA